MLRRTWPFLLAVAAVMLSGVWGWRAVVESRTGAPDVAGGDDASAGRALDRDGAMPEGDGVRLLEASEDPSRGPPDPSAGGGTSIASAEDAGPAGATAGGAELDAAPGDVAIEVGTTSSLPGGAPVGTSSSGGGGPGSAWGIQIRGTQGVLSADEEVPVQAGYARIGTPAAKIEGLLRARGPNAPRALLYEAPRHAVWMEPYFIEIQEVTNSRWFRFLWDTSADEFRTPVGDAETLLETVVALIGPRAPDPWDPRITARQLYESNRGTLDGAFKDLVVTSPDGDVDEEKTLERMLEASLPDDLLLRFFTRAPPSYWPSITFLPDVDANEPVRDLSLEDAVDFAIWSGKHVPSEFEWEYACRGPKGSEFPWGNDGSHYDDRVNGGEPLAHDEEPELLEVRALPDGASWLGCLQMLGNVEEWTSSWLDPYEGSSLPPLPIPVVRGGSAASEDRVLARPALRGWSPNDPAGAPAYRARRPWAGARLARYEKVGRSRLPNMHTRMRAVGIVDPEVLEPEVYAARQGEIRRLEVGAGWPDDASLRLGVKSFVIQPLRTVAIFDPEERIWRSDPKRRAAGVGSLLAASDTEPVLLGLAHSDLTLVDLWVRVDRGGRIRDERGVLPAGTWWVGLVERRLAFLSPDLEQVVFVTRGPEVSSAVLSVHDRLRARGRSWLRVEERSGKVEERFSVPLGEPDAQGKVANVRLLLRMTPEAIGRVEVWAEGAYPE